LFTSGKIVERGGLKLQGGSCGLKEANQLVDKRGKKCGKSPKKKKGDPLEAGSQREGTMGRMPRKARLPCTESKQNSYLIYAERKYQHERLNSKHCRPVAEEY